MLDPYNYTSDGGRMWAEGPFYLHYASASMLSLWHATRVNRMGTNPASPFFGVIPDPFSPSSWHLGPLRWLADLTTPQGQTPPLDDGNRHWMYNAHLFAWDYTYADGSLGARFA